VEHVLGPIDEEQAAWETLRGTILDLGEDLPYRLEPYRSGPACDPLLLPDGPTGRG